MGKNFEIAVFEILAKTLSYCKVQPNGMTRKVGILEVSSIVIKLSIHEYFSG